MAAATAPHFSIDDRAATATVRNANDYGGAGWVGSKAGKVGDFVQIDSNGYTDQAAAAGAAVAGTVDVGILNTKVASTVAAASAEAMDVEYRICSDKTRIWLPQVNNSDTFTTVTDDLIGDARGIYRRSTGDYAWDSNGSGHGIVVAVDVARGLMACVLIEANRLK